MNYADRVGCHSGCGWFIDHRVMRTEGGLRFGGKRNYGYGMARVTETQVVDLDTLDYCRNHGVWS